MRLRAAAAGLACLLLALVTAGCGTLLPSQPTPPATPGPPVVPAPKPGPVDLALFGVIGDNGAGTLRLFVSMDLLAR
jgi:hypothetical protein